LIITSAANSGIATANAMVLTLAEASSELDPRNPDTMSTATAISPP
jgi:hypothetical protein